MISTKIFTILAVVAGVLAQDPLSCYDNFGNRDVAACARFIDDFCDTLTPNIYRPRDNGQRCYVVNGHKCDFTVFNTNNGGSPIRASTPNCKTVLRAAANRCPTGGRGKINPSAPFLFAIDPNDGDCSTGF
uniref:TMV inhibitor protein Y3 n=1 Tax=Coprinus comatus TaxID=56187 RepID=R4HEK3_COPCM|nr:TMV inhibitor protein Y3 [Coprinus comatus]